MGLADDSNHTVPKQMAKAGFKIGFPGMSAISAALRERDYAEVYEELADARAYNMKLLDGAMVQMMYEFRDGALLRHRLAFFPSPRLAPFQEEPEIYLQDTLFAEIVSRRIVPVPFRFDFDAREGVFAELVHPKCHFTLGQYENCRIPVTAPLTPRWFIDFILRNFYHTAFHQYAEKLPVHGALFETSISPKEQQIVHVLAPAATR
ncbi:DUF2290 domain-containing protein [Candidatus Thiosymbion oneisti]|uniref:DUF2290 domain-containing protein n=2 Tax=Candidatus Thiosymbion oneisti TaxID=589554 RepID=UPI001AAD179E|nr:DUF2290 domain-containing protein [Candidatus Thiosymbion oneisti]